MKTDILKLTNKRRGAQRVFFTGVAVTLAVMTMGQPRAGAAVLAVDLNSAAGFAVLAGAGITVAGAVDSTTITGDIGSHPTPTITGLGNVVLHGVNHAGNAVTEAAKDDLVTAYNDAVGRPADFDYADGTTLPSLLAPGVHKGAGSLTVTGDITLDALGDPASVWIIQANSTLITGSNSTVTLTGGALAGNVFWQVGSSATLGTGTEFVGTIMALTSITVNTGAEIDGRLLARNGAVTLDSNIVTVPEPGSILLGGLGLLALMRRRRRLAAPL